MNVLITSHCAHGGFPQLIKIKTIFIHKCIIIWTILAFVKVCSSIAVVYMGHITLFLTPVYAQHAKWLWGILRARLVMLFSLKENKEHGNKGSDSPKKPLKIAHKM